MSKKRFSEGLEDLFQHNAGDASTAALPQGEGAATERRHASKNFTRDLEALFEAAMSEEDDFVGTEAPSPVATTMATHHRAAGLDALIRPTETQGSETAEAGAALKRLTVTVERAKLEKLRSLARVENLYLKDILQRAIDEYLKKHDPEADKSL